jgi:glucokinase
LKGIGLAFPGLVNTISKKVISTNKKYDDAPLLNLEEWVQQKWQTSFFMDNDARMAAVGEWKFGAGKGIDNLVAVTLGTGIGSAAIIEGNLLRGKHFQAGILGGHISLNYKGDVCTCGNIGCAEAEASTWNISHKIKNDDLFSKSILALEQNLDFEALFRAARENDTLAIQKKDECISIWATAIINLIHAYDPEMVILSGGILNSKEVIIPSIQKAVDTYAWCPWGKVSIQASTLINKAGILGITYCLDHQV